MLLKCVFSSLSPFIRVHTYEKQMHKVNSCRVIWVIRFYETSINLSSSFVILLSVKVAWPETESPLRFPLTRPLYALRTDRDGRTSTPRSSKTTNRPVVEASTPASFILQVTVSTAPENVQTKVTEWPIDPVTLFPRYGDLNNNCIWPTTQERINYSEKEQNMDVWTKVALQG